MFALAMGLFAVPAWADGDPASDVLATQPLFLPQDAAIAVGQQTQIAGILGEAARSGYPIRVALIASPGDLGSVTALWRKPQTYARFLAQELALVYRGPLLVVMPSGLGIENVRRAPAAASTGPNLGVTTLTAIRTVAAAAGHPLALPRGASATTAPSTGAAPWIAFAAGAILIAVAWSASLRARPPQLRGSRAL